MEYKERLKKFNSFYLALVISVGAVIAAAIVLGVFVRVSAGLIVGICGVLVYLLLLSDEMKRGLGLWYKRVDGGIACSAIASKKLVGCTERHIPERLMWLDVVELCPPMGKDRPDRQISVLYLPVSVKKIDKNAFSGMDALCLIAYGGSADDWKGVSCEADISGIEIEFLREAER